MTSITSAEVATRANDLRTALLLGIANWYLFLDHIPNNVVSILTLHNFGFSGATDLFALAGGYAVALTYGKMALDRGYVVAITRIFKRVWQLYAAYIVLFVVYVDLISYVAGRTEAPELFSEFNITGFIDHPLRILIDGLRLQAKPLNLDVLQLVIAVMAALPVILLGLLRLPSITLAASIALYAIARARDWNLPSYPDSHWYFNPFCWQLLFVLGGWLALASKRQARVIRAMQASSAWRAAALLYLLFALTIVASRTVPFLADILPHWLIDTFSQTDKDNISLSRILHLLALTFLFSQFVPRGSPYLDSPAVQPVIKCGEEWLAVFCAGVFLSFAAHLVLITGPNSVLMQIVVSIAGIAAMTAVAYYVSWSKHQDYKSAVGASS